MVIHSQAHLEPHLQTDGVMMVELLLTQVLLVEVVVPEASVVMVISEALPIMVMEHTVEQVFNFLQHIETHPALCDSLDQVVVDIG